jgi:hypothetical protein
MIHLRAISPRILNALERTHIFLPPIDDPENIPPIRREIPVIYIPVRFPR